MVSDPLGEYQTDLGILSEPPGVTIAGIRYALYVNTSAAQTGLGAQLWWGFITVPNAIAPGALDPSASQHADWMEYGQARTGPVSFFRAVGNDYSGRLEVKVSAKRKIRGPEDILVFAMRVVTTTGTWDFHLLSTTVLMLA